MVVSNDLQIGRQTEIHVEMIFARTLGASTGKRYITFCVCHKKLLSLISGSGNHSVSDASNVYREF